MAGGEGQGFGLLQSWHPDAQALFKKYGIKGGGVKQLQEMYGHKAIPIMREMAGADPVSFLEMLSEKFKKGLAAGHLRKDMFKDRQWLSFYEEILGTDFIERFKRDLAKVNETAALGPEGMLKGLQMEHKTEPGMAYQRLEQSAGGFAEAMARAGPLMNAMNRLADVMYIHSQQVMAQKVLESSSSPRQAGRAYQEWMDLEDKKPGWAPSKILPSISKWLGFDAKGVDANMRAMNTDALKEGKEPGFWNTFQQARNILAQAVTGQGFYFDLRDETEGWKKSVPGYSTFQEGERLKALRDPLDPLADIARLGNAGITSSLLLPENSESFQYKNLPEYGFMGQAFSMQEGGQGGFPWSKSPETWLSESTAKADVASAESMSVTAKSVTITAGSVSVSGAVATSGDKGGNELSSGVKQEKWM